MTTLEKEMRSWLKECFTEEEEHEQIDEFNFDNLVKFINRYYDNGFEQFILDIID